MVFNLGDAIDASHTWMRSVDPLISGVINYASPDNYEVNIRDVLYLALQHDQHKDHEAPF